MIFEALGMRKRVSRAAQAVEKGKRLFTARVKGKGDQNALSIHLMVHLSGGKRAGMILRKESGPL